MRGYSGEPGGRNRSFFCQGRLLLSLTYGTFRSPRHTLQTPACAENRARTTSAEERTTAFDREILGASQPTTIVQSPQRRSDSRLSSQPLSMTKGPTWFLSPEKKTKKNETPVILQAASGNKKKKKKKGRAAGLGETH